MQYKTLLAQTRPTLHVTQCTVTWRKKTKEEAKSTSTNVSGLQYEQRSLMAY